MVVGARIGRHHCPFRAADQAARVTPATSRQVRMAMAAMADPDARPKDIARELGVTTTLYVHGNGDGSPKEAAEMVLRRPTRS